MSRWIDLTAGGGGGGYQLIGGAVAVGGETSLALTDIPATFQHLQFRTHFISNQGAFLTTEIQFNADAGAHYDFTQNVVTNTNERVSGQTSLLWASGIKSTDSTLCFSDGILDLPYYNSTVWKNFFGNTWQPANDDPTDGFLVQFGGRWRGTAAINEINLIASAAAFGAGSSVEVWGIG